MKGYIKKKKSIGMYWLLQIQEGIRELAVWTFKLKQELLAGHLWTVTASEDSSLLYVPNCLTLTTAKGSLREASFSSVYSIKGAKTSTPKWVRDSWQSSRKRKVLLAEKMGKCKSENYINSNFIASLWLRQLLQLKYGRESNLVQASDGAPKEHSPQGFLVCERPRCF